MFRTALSLLCIAATAAPAVSAQVAPQTKKLDLALLLDMERVSSPRLSPDGTEIVFTRRWVDKVADHYHSELWIMNSDGSRQRFLTEGSSPRWSPGGKRLAFSKQGKPRGSQIHVMWVATREVTQITRTDETPSAFRWSPDGKLISFSMRVPEKTGFKISLPKRPKGAKWAPDPKVITRLNYRRDHRGYRPSGYTHLFVVDARGGTPRQVTSGEFDHRGGEWTPDGKRLVFSGLRVPDADWVIRESEIYAVEVATGRIHQLTHHVGPDYNPVVSPDGKWIAYQVSAKNDDTYNTPELYLMASDGSGARQLLAPDRRISHLMWDVDSQGLYFNQQTEGASNLRYCDLEGDSQSLTTGRQMFSANDIDKTGIVVGTNTSAHEPGDIVRLVPGTGGQLQRLTQVNDDVLDGVKLGDVEEFWYESKGGLRCQGWIVKPPDFDPNKKYPLILRIHGGPHAMYNVGFSFEVQNHAANGYVVLYTNPRGSTGYGKEFGNAINHAYPGQDYDDLMKGVDTVIAKGYIDQRNLFVYGGSGGGVLTAWTVGHTQRFRAAVSMYPVIDWISFVGTTDGPYWYHNFAKLWYQ